MGVKKKYNTVAVNTAVYVSQKQLEIFEINISYRYEHHTISGHLLFFLFIFSIFHLVDHRRWKGSGQKIQHGSVRIVPVRHVSHHELLHALQLVYVVQQVLP